MTIEEKCGCGAALTLRVTLESGRLRETERAASAREAWKQVDRWRKLHAHCRRGPSIVPLHVLDDSGAAAGVLAASPTHREAPQ